MISRLLVQNFKIHQQTEVCFNDGLSILTGENNSGKTSLLEAVLIFSECYHHALHKIQRASSRYVKSNLLKVGQYQLDGLFIPYFSSVRSENYFELFFKGKASFSIEADFVCDGHKICLAFNVAHGRNQTAYWIEPVISNESLVLLNQCNPEYFLQVLKSSPVPAVMRNEPYLPPKMLAKQMVENVQASTIRNRLYLVSQQHKLAELQAQLQYIMGFDFFELSVSFDINKDLYINAAFRVHKQADFQDIAILGSGTLQILEVLISLNLQAQASNKVVLLDEPDSFLHRRLQSNLITKLREIAQNNIQVICTTHNEQIIASAQLSEVFHLGGATDSQTVKALSADLPAGRKIGFLASGAKTALYDSLGISASAMTVLEAIEAERVILLEGRTDALYLSALQAKRQMLFPGVPTKQVAFWSLNGISDLANKLNYWKAILSQLKNAKSVWEKSVLMLDTDFLAVDEKQFLAQSIQQKHQLACVFAPAYTVEGVLLVDQARAIKLLSCWSGVIETDVATTYYDWLAELSIDDRLSSITGQRQTRGVEFAGFECHELTQLNVGTRSLNYIEQLRQSPSLGATLANKQDIELLLSRVVSLSGVHAYLTVLSFEEHLLGLIDCVDGTTWQPLWTTLLKPLFD